MDFRYSVALIPDAQDGGYVVTCRDLPEAITQGDSIEEALAEAADCLEEAVAGRIDDHKPIPFPSRTEPGEYWVAVPIQTALKATLYLAMREANIGLDELAKRLGMVKENAAELLDPRHGCETGILEKALAAVGKRVALEVFEAA